MTRSKAKGLVSLIQAAIKSKSLRKSSSKPSKKSVPHDSLSSLLDDSLSKEDSGDKLAEDSLDKLREGVSSILCTGGSNSLQDSEEMTNYRSYLGRDLSIPWNSNLSNNNTSVRRKEVSRERKQKYMFKQSQVLRFNRLVRLCGDELGTDFAEEVFGKLGRETGVKEYNAFIATCLQKARTSNDEEDALKHLSRAFKHFKRMRELGFKVEEGTYGPILKYFIDMGMVEEFHFFCAPIKEGNRSSLPRLGYYEMLLWIGVNNEEKIHELCKAIAAGDGKDDSKLKENYLLALCESGRERDLIQLLETLDITRISSVNLVASIFQSLGKQSLEPLAEKFLLALKKCDYGMDNISRLIYSYASGIPNLAVQDLFLKFKSLHIKFKITPSSASYVRLITYCCDLYKVHFALDIAEQMCEAGLSLPMETVHLILHACEESYEFNLVRRIYSLICQHSLKPTSETFRSMISLFVKMKDFNSAYEMLNDLKKLNVTLTTSIYNTIMAGYFREKNLSGALMVLKQMESQDLKPDAYTFSYLIGHCNSEEDILKYYEEMKHAGVPVTKHVFMALINAYAASGQFEKAKEVLLDKRIPPKSLNEVKSVLVSALASSGKVRDALNIYKEIKQNGASLEPKAVISLIEYFPCEGDLSTLLQLLEELHDPDFWVDGCCRIVLLCVRNKYLRSAVALLKELKDKLHKDDLAMDVIFDEIFSVIAEGEPKDLQIGLALFQAMKDELGLTPSRKSLDFLLTACTNARDLQNSLFIWNEYQAAGLPRNVLTFLRMYPALLASGDSKSAKNMLSKIPTDDPHVRCVIDACQKTYIQSTSSKIKKKKKKKQQQQKLNSEEI